MFTPSPGSWISGEASLPVRVPNDQTDRSRNIISQLCHLHPLFYQIIQATNLPDLNRNEYQLLRYLIRQGAVMCELMKIIINGDNEQEQFRCFHQSSPDSRSAVNLQQCQQNSLYFLRRYQAVNQVELDIDPGQIYQGDHRTILMVMNLMEEMIIRARALLPRFPGTPPWLTIRQPHQRNPSIQSASSVYSQSSQDEIISPLQSPPVAPDQHRQIVARVDELVQTETTYVQTLKRLQHWKQVLCSHHQLSTRQVEDFIPDINNLYEFHCAFLLDLQNAQNRPIEDIVDRVGVSFVAFGTVTQCYKRWLTRSTVIHDCMRHPELVDIIPVTVAPDGLDALMLQPVQRLCRYPLLLEALIHQINKEDQQLATKRVNGIHQLDKSYSRMIELASTVNVHRRMRDSEMPSRDLLAKIRAGANQNDREMLSRTSELIAELSETQLYSQMCIVHPDGREQWLCVFEQGLYWFNMPVPVRRKPSLKRSFSVRSARSAKSGHSLDSIPETNEAPTPTLVFDHQLLFNRIKYFRHLLTTTTVRLVTTMIEEWHDITPAIPVMLEPLLHLLERFVVVEPDTTQPAIATDSDVLIKILFETRTATWLAVEQTELSHLRFADFRGRICRHLDIEESPSVALDIRYLDPDNDWVRLETNADLDIAISDRDPKQVLEMSVKFKPAL